MANATTMHRVREYATKSRIGGGPTPISEPLNALKTRFPEAVIWFGEATGKFWALVGDRLIENETARGLALNLGMEALGWSAPEPETFVEPVGWFRSHIGMFRPRGTGRVAVAA
ncbi:hypothetical protein GCM10022221_81910 [Actinocorallia aurea]